MMKRYMFVCIWVFCSFVSCEKEGILENSNDVSYLYFSKSVWKDSTVMSFFFYEHDRVEIPVEMSLSGCLLEKDGYFRLSVDTALTTAQPENYDISEPFVFHAGRVKDTIRIKLINTEGIATGKYRLVLKIEKNETFELGAIPHQRVKIVMSNEIAKPAWWKDQVEALLGKFSRKKYELLIQRTHVSDLTGMNSGQIRELALILKRYVEDWEAEHGELMMDEENGERMTIPVIG